MKTKNTIEYYCTYCNDKLGEVDPEYAHNNPHGFDLKIENESDQHGCKEQRFDIECSACGAWLRSVDKGYINQHNDGYTMLVEQLYREHASECEEQDHPALESFIDMYEPYLNSCRLKNKGVNN